MLQSASETAIELQNFLNAAFPDDVEVGVRPISVADRTGLIGDELGVVKSAEPARVASFATGRVLLRAVTGAGEIAVGPMGAPVLPPGVIASLSHDDRFAVAVMAGAEVVAIGVDIEPIVDFELAIVDLVRRRDEAGLEPFAVFVAKEAVYKAWSMSGGDRVLDHHDVRLTLEPSGFVAEVVADRLTFEVITATVADRVCALALRRQ